jgi:hypothetical protein
MASFAHLLSPVKLNDSGQLESQVVSPLERLRTQAAVIASGNTEILSKWFFSQAIDRELTPLAHHTTRAYIDARIEEGSAKSLDEAEMLAEGDSAILDRIEQKRLHAASYSHP